jgi:uncharacterized membrane protein YgdD (TMEM256/DUF423 family)
MRFDGPRILASSGVLLALATLLGAFGAHGLLGELSPDRLSVYLTADRYQFFQSLGLLGVGLAARAVNAALLRRAGALLLIGIVLFCGSLYALAFGAPHALGILTPLGGLLLIAGWVAFVSAMWRSRTR